MDLTNKPVLGKGFCIKEACSQSYATDCGAVAVIQQICEKNQIPYQKFVNRSDLAEINSSFNPTNSGFSLL
jgi:aspartyl aminopeptidase